MSGFLLLLVKVNLVMGAAIVLVSLVRRQLRVQFGAPIAYAIWLLVPIATVASLLPPREVPAPAHIATVRAPSAPILIMGHPANSALRAVEQLAGQSALTPPAPMKPPASTYGQLDTSLVLFAAWALGTLFMAVYLIRVQIRFSAAVRQGQAGPAVVGFFRPRIVTPDGFQERFTAQEQSAILAHERVHLARQDARINALAAFLRCLCWFNPLIHLGARWLRTDQELACDAITVSGAISRRDYSTALLKSQIMVGVLPFGCNWPGPQHPLVERIALLRREPPGTTRRLAGVSLVLLTAASAGLGAWAAQPPVAAKSMTAPQPGIALTTLPAILAAPVAHTQAKASQFASIREKGPGIFLRSDGPTASPPKNDTALSQANRMPTSPDPDLAVKRNGSDNVVVPQSSLSTGPTAIVARPDLTASNDPITVRVPDLGAGDNLEPNVGNGAAGPQRSTADSLPKTHSSSLINVSGRNSLDASQIGAGSRFLCRNLTSVTGIVISPRAIQMHSLVCGNPIGNRFASFGDDLRTDPINRDGFRNVPAAHTTDKSIVIMNVNPATANDALKMVIGKTVTISGDFSLIQTDSMNFLIADNAAYLHGDPFGR